jgi:long-chain acyl-CoA synthetase
MPQTVADRPWLSACPEGVPHEFEPPAEPLFAALERAAGRFPDRPAIDFPGRLHTYGELRDLVRRAAAGLQRLGVGKGSRVALFLPNTAYYVICYYAVLEAGGIVVNCSPSTARASSNGSSRTAVRASSSPRTSRCCCPRRSRSPAAAGSTG